MSTVISNVNQNQAVQSDESYNPVMDYKLDIKDRLRAHLYKMQDAKYQRERISMIESSLLPGSPKLDDMPHAPGGSDGVMLDAMVRMAEIEDDVASLLVELDDERREIEKLVTAGIKSPARRAVIRMRYLDGAGWDSITEAIYGEEYDYSDPGRRIEYKDLTHNLHYQALCNLRDYIRKAHPEIEKFNHTSIFFIR